MPESEENTKPPLDALGGLPRPDKPCNCPHCDCRLHVFPHTNTDVCAWCHHDEHDDKERDNDS